MAKRKKNKRSLKSFAPKHKVTIVIIVLLLFMILTGLLSLRFEGIRVVLHAVTDPVCAVFDEIGDRITGAFDHQTEDELREENSALKEQIEALEEENRILRSDARRTNELETLYELDTYFADYEKTGASVVGLSPNNWITRMTLDKGSLDGISEYMPVIASGGLVGHVSEVFANYAYVTTVISENSVVYGQVNRADGDLVVLKGIADSSVSARKSGLMVITYDAEEVDIVLGDEIVTSTLGDIYPPGLSIGTVISITEGTDGAESLAYVLPTADLNQIDMVLVITEIWKEDLPAEEPSASESGD